MSNKNLVQELGANYVNGYFRGALFKDEGDIYQFLSVASGTKASALKMTAAGHWEEVVIPVSKLKGFTTFSIPKLGYRNLESRNLKAVAQLSSTRSTKRGFRLEGVMVDYLDDYSMVYPYSDPVWEFMSSEQRTNIIYNPTFTPLKIGLQELMEGRLSSFAMSPDIAVALDTDADSDKPWAIYFKSIKVGAVDGDGVVSVNNKVVSRNAVRRELELFE